jgi:hypothetical protein
LDDFGDVLVVDVPVLLLVSFCIETGSGIIHVLVVAGSGIFVVGGDVDNGTSLDWKVGITNSVSSSDFWALCVQSNGKRSAWKFLFCGFGVVYDRLVVLKMGEYFAGLRNALSRKLTSYDPWEKFMRTTLRPTGEGQLRESARQLRVFSTFAEVIDSLHGVGLWAYWELSACAK